MNFAPPQPACKQSLQYRFGFLAHCRVNDRSTPLSYLDTFQSVLRHFPALRSSAKIYRSHELLSSLALG
jgi:hypothetical protein